MKTVDMRWPKQFEHSDYTSEVGDRLLLGRHHGAYAHHYRVTERVSPSRVKLLAVIGQSVRNEDGTFSTVWAEAC